MAHVLLVDDDPVFIAEQVRQAFPAPEHTVTVAKSGAEGLELIHSTLPDVVLLDLRLPDRSGLEVYEDIRRLDARLPVIFITMEKSADTAIEAMKRGAFNYVFKPIDLEQLESTVREAIEAGQQMRRPVMLQQAALDPMEEGALLGTCPAMLEVYKAIGRVAEQDVTVLVTGESGTGKELVTRAIYQHSARSTTPFHALNCAAIPESLLESELFGHERGAFTGADRRRIGKFEQYSGGTILLDEVGDMPPALQAKVLRVLQEQSFERVGGNETVRTDVRLIAATHHDLNERVKDGKFRLDLFYRLGVFTIHLPPLRERGEDLPLLALHHVRRFSREFKREVREIAPETMNRLRAYAWPGNIRELQSVLKQAVLRAHGYTLLPSFLPAFPASKSSARREADVARDAPTSARETPSPAAMTIDVDSFVRERLADGSRDLYAETRNFVDRLLFTRVLAHTKGNYSAAADVLGIARQTMRVKLRALGITVAHSVELDDDQT
ncbi:MAG: Response regulator of zinc sigma-54-dependent two-component system [Labilithrix sp.]|nr:Response regulator of zinc sigma-54-dependent two-component system [Labilithrix sp.]